jgi:hypothetical protein
MTRDEVRHLVTLHAELVAKQEAERAEAIVSALYAALTSRPAPSPTSGSSSTERMRRKRERDAGDASHVTSQSVTSDVTVSLSLLKSSISPQKAEEKTEERELSARERDASQPSHVTSPAESDVTPVTPVTQSEPWARLWAEWCDLHGALLNPQPHKSRMVGILPLCEQLATARGVTPEAVFRQAATRFKADPQVKRKGLSIAVLCSQFEVWSSDTPPAVKPGYARAPTLEEFRDTGDDFPDLVANG